MILCALSIFAIVILILSELMLRSGMAWHKFGFKFFFQPGTRDRYSGLLNYWDPVNGDFGALPFIYGTLWFLRCSRSLISVPFALGVAIFLTEMCPEVPAWAARVPYGTAGCDSERRLWALGHLCPDAAAARICESVALEVLGLDGLFADRMPRVFGMLAAGVVLAIMILPIISSLTREVMTAVPKVQREAVLALGATRWEMIRMGVLRNARIGIVGAIILGLGRALGETMAVTMVIGNRPEIVQIVAGTGLHDGQRDRQ